jgi:hypothetical protein
MPPVTLLPFCAISIAVDDEQVGAVVDLMSLKLLAAGQADSDRAGLVVRARDLGAMGLKSPVSGYPNCPCGLRVSGLGQ